MKALQWAAAVALELLLAVWLAVVSAGALGAPGTKHWASRRLRRCGKPELSWAKARSQILGFPYRESESARARERKSREEQREEREREREKRI